MTPDLIVEYAAIFAIVILVIALLLTVYRAVVGPTLPDRVIALDMLVGIVIGFIAVIALRTGYTLYIDIAIALGLVGFLATVAFARFILARGCVGEGEGVETAKPAASNTGKAVASGTARLAAAKAPKKPKAVKPAAPLGSKEAK
ncbi:multicomponent Na+:H+ antiporter subunit F [Rhizobium rosettiformans]|uniref:Multicomponent Na+:H+ antiporter subunit F n=1 Tax=Rhizobium rosettiformans TaxID=1368430 RepID=A0A7W8HLR2_9HYPH|nr:cation:proton antiporter [Rhizobium rosettiformans]MBA4798893.1 cation:proton antiporter [Hyphomicrobiales bacterium]MBB5274308.1 multicomponent Na+:H+ antiporter subunit F [Rhizobium rosettiformans]